MSAPHAWDIYKLRDGKRRWFAALCRYENSVDDEGRVADRPRFVLYVGGERHERPDPEAGAHRLWPIGQLEYDRLAGAHDAGDRGQGLRHPHREAACSKPRREMTMASNLPPGVDVNPLADRLAEDYRDDG